MSVLENGILLNIQKIKLEPKRFHFCEFNSLRKLNDKTNEDLKTKENCMGNCK